MFEDKDIDESQYRKLTVEELSAKLEAELPGILKSIEDQRRSRFVSHELLQREFTI